MTDIKNWGKLRGMRIEGSSDREKRNYERQEAHLIAFLYVVLLSILILHYNMYYFAL